MSDDRFRSRDLSLVAYLSLRGFAVVEFMWANSICWFYLESSPDLNEEVQLYRSGEALADPKQYAECLRDMKAEMFLAKTA